MYPLGVPNLVRADMVKPGAAIIDVGITRVINPQTSKSTLVGDVDYEGVSEVAGYITPVPGGVGPMTVAMLMRNTIAAAKKSVVYNILDPGAVIYKQASQLKPWSWTLNIKIISCYKLEWIKYTKL